MADQRRIVLCGLDRLPPAVDNALSAAARALEGELCRRAGVDEVRAEITRCRRHDALGAVVLGPEVADAELVHLAQSLGGRFGLAPVIALRSDPRDEMTPVALEAGCCDVLSFERSSADELVRALRLALEVARRQRAESPWLESADARTAWPPPALDEMRRLAGLGRSFVALTHDLKNLLQPILGYAELLEEPAMEAEKRIEFAGEIVRLAEETDALLRRALVAAPGTRIAVEPREGDSLLRGAERLLRSMVGGKVRLRLACGAPGVRVAVPEGALSQILLNLAANARDSMVAGGLLDVRSKREGDRWVIEVEDTGIGIPARDLGRVFEPGHSTKSGGVGAGLGLWIVRGLAEALGGKVRLSSRVGSGTLVTVVLPTVPD